jgi:hypothetical protein
MVALSVVLMVILSFLLDGKNSLVKFVALTGLVVRLCFSIFMLFACKPVSHPTIATFDKATLGFGVLLFPVFIPAWVVRSMMCKRLHGDNSFECESIW